MDSVCTNGSRFEGSLGSQKENLQNCHALIKQLSEKILRVEAVSGRNSPEYQALSKEFDGVKNRIYSIRRDGSNKSKNPKKKIDPLKSSQGSKKRDSVRESISKTIEELEIQTRQPFKQDLRQRMGNLWVVGDELAPQYKTLFDCVTTHPSKVKKIEKDILDAFNEGRLTSEEQNLLNTKIKDLCKDRPYLKEDFMYF